jgi:PAS domain S-box-containing protein
MNPPIQLSVSRDRLVRNGMENIGCRAENHKPGTRIENKGVLRHPTQGVLRHPTLSQTPPSKTIRSKSILDQPTDKSPQAVTDGSATFEDSSRYLLAAIIESSDDAIISKNMQGIITSWNNAAQRVFGYTADEIVGQPILRLIPEELHSEEFEIIKKIRAGERIDHYETVRVRKNGEKFLISVTISPVRDNTGRVIGASKVARDVSDRKRSEDSRFHLAAIVDSADDAIISKDLNGIIKTWNHGAHTMFGYTSEEMIGQPMLRLIPEDLHYEEDEILRKLRAGERIDHYETTRVKKNGDLLEVSVTISPIRNHENKVIGASKIARDISDRKRMEKVLILSEKLAATGRMAATIAHEVNNPLESLMNLIYLARQSCTESSQAQGYLITAEGELERVSHIARQTLGFYRDTGSPVDVYLHDLIVNVLTVYQSKLLTSRISVESSFNDLRKISVSRGEMLQIFSNLITNSIDAMKEGGKLSVSLRKTTALDRDGIQTVIRDTGTGISPENLEKIFEPFFTTKGNLGTGIGLWVTRQLVEFRGGQIAVTSSTEPGKSGTSVTIFIPFAAPKKSGLQETKETISEP